MLGRLAGWLSAAAGTVAALAAAGAAAQDARFEALAEQYVEELLDMNPELATALGDHRYDDRLDDYTLEGVGRNLERERRFRDRLAGIDVERLGDANAIDYRILASQIESSIFAIEELREHEWDPLRYNVGGAVYALLARDFAPLEERLENVAARLRSLPAALDAAKANLGNPPRIHTETAILQNGGTIALVRDELEGFLEQAPDMRPLVEPAQRAAVEALEAYGEWLERDLLPRSDGDFRLGERRFRAKLAHTLDSDLSMEEILSRAEQSLADTQDELYRTALPLYRRFVPDASAEQTLDRRLVIRTVLDELAKERPADATIVEQARADLEETTRFVRERRLVSLPDEPVEIIVMPEFQRGVSVAYCDPPGPLEENGETFYAISPTPEDWTEERTESFYREYNDFMLKNLTVHEAMPGHYLQIAHSNAFEAPTKVRAIFWSGTFVEGWAHYAEELMTEHGYGGPEVRIQQLKMKLRAIINAILDQKIHTAGMTEQEAMRLMMEEGFQEEGEAAAKWRRAALTSTQLSTYFVGFSEVMDIRRAYASKHGGIEDFRELHDRMLAFGSPPAKYVKAAMGL
ncbi:MAG: DUF885 domain-containing protein [Gammaproteobacteria bacterium]|nr:DUF885 domain-containing protein [Gammaproteobacteria bacterium]